MPASKKPLALLFDIGGVCVVSPFQAILDYEKAQGIPLGYTNWSISQTGPNGAWQRLERGEIVADKTFYDHWKADLQDEKRWWTYYARYLEEQRKEKGGDTPGEAAYSVPPVPNIDAEGLHNEMMSNARYPDPHMLPALKKLRHYADQSGSNLILGALSNTCIFPPGHFLYDSTTADGKASKGLGGIFDIFASSAHIGMRKPDEEAYRYAIVRLREFARMKGYLGGVDPEDIIFLDDIGANLRTARGLGMRTIKVNLGHTDLAVKELEKATGLNLTEDRARL